MKKIPFMIAIAIIISILASITTFSNRTEVISTVNRIEKIENVNTSEGYVSTEVYYLLFTSKGTMRLSIHGFLAHPELLGRIKIDSTYTFCTMGVEIPFVGFYPNVVSVK